MQLREWSGIPRSSYHQNWGGHPKIGRVTRSMTRVTTDKAVKVEMLVGFGDEIKLCDSASAKRCVSEFDKESPDDPTS